MTGMVFQTSVLTIVYLLLQEIKSEPKKSDGPARPPMKKQISAGGSHVAELANKLGNTGNIRIGPQAAAPVVRRGM